MKKITLLALLFNCFTASAQMVAITEIKEDIPGVCNIKKVYHLFPMWKGQEEAICPVKKDSIEKRLNSEVAFLKENTDFKGEGMVFLLINCKGEVLKCQMDNKTKSEVLDSQIVAVFNSLGQWKAGKLDGKDVDSSQLYSFDIKNGKVKLNK